MSVLSFIENVSDKIGGNGFVIKGAFSSAECDEILKPAISNGFHSANDKYPDSYRNNERYWEDNDTLTYQLTQKMMFLFKSNAALNQSTKEFTSLNSRLRFCKYKEGQVFNVHRDGVYHKNSNECSKMTFLLYLNEDYRGGETNFYKDKNKAFPTFSYKGCKGDLLVFDHDIWHEGCEVLSGEKHILRSDLIFRTSNTDIFHNGYVWDILNYEGSFYTAGRDKNIKRWGGGLDMLAENEVHEASVLSLEGLFNNIYSISRDGNFSKLTKNLELVDKVDSKHSCPLSVSAVNEDLLTTGSDGVIRIWDTDLNQLKETDAHDGWCWKCIKINEDVIASIGSDGLIKSWDSNLENIASENLFHGSLRCCDVEGDTVYVGCEDGCLLEVCISTFKIKVEHDLHVGIIRDVTVHGDYIYTCGEDGRIMKTCRKNMLRTLIGESSDFVSSLAFNDKGVLHSVGYDGVISVR